MRKDQDSDKSKAVITCPVCGKPLRLVSVEAGNGVVTKTFHCDHCGEEHITSESL